MQKLVDDTDRTVRWKQLVAMACSTILVSSAGAVFALGRGPVWAPILALVAGLAGIVIAGGIRQRWELSYKGHDIRFENSPLTGERLYLDGGLVARGGVGSKIEIRAPIRVGDGAGEEIMALVDAGVLGFRLRIYVEGAAVVAEAASMAAVTQAPPHAPPPPATAAHQTGALGGLVMARRGVEFVGSLITIVTTVATLALWLFQSVAP